MTKLTSHVFLVRFLYPEVGNVVTRFFDMPVVSIGTASNLFDVCLAKNGLDFSKVSSFMSDSTNVMKGVRSNLFPTVPILLDFVPIFHNSVPILDQKSHFFMDFVPIFDCDRLAPMCSYSTNLTKYSL